MPFVIQNSYILLAPALFAATIYMILGRVISLTEGNKYSIVSARRLTWFFLIGDIFCFALQGGGNKRNLMDKSMTNILTSLQAAVWLQSP
jgi:hypothetical protein